MSDEEEQKGLYEQNNKTHKGMRKTLKKRREKSKERK